MKARMPAYLWEKVAAWWCLSSEVIPTAFPFSLSL